MEPCSDHSETFHHTQINHGQFIQNVSERSVSLANSGYVARLGERRLPLGTNLPIASL